MTASTTAIAHPRIQERREAVEDELTRRRQRRLRVLGAAVLIVLLALGATQTPLLDVDEVRIIGATTTGPNALRAVADIEQGTPLVGLDLSEAESRLLAMPEIAAVTSTRQWNGVITIEVQERRAVARITTLDGEIMVASDGMVLALDQGVNSSLPVVAGAMFSAPIGGRVPEEVADAVAAAEALPSDIARLSERIVIGADRLSIDLVGGGVVELGDARDLDAKYDALRAFLGQVDLRCLDVIDVQAPTVPILARDVTCG